MCLKSDSRNRAGSINWPDFITELTNLIPDLETSGPGDIKNETVGPPLSHWEEVKIDEDGQILVKGKSIFVGYYKRPEALSEMVKDGRGPSSNVMAIIFSSVFILQRELK